MARNRFRAPAEDKVALGVGCTFVGFYLLVIAGVLTFWGLVIYALYLLVTGQLKLG